MQLFDGAARVTRESDELDCSDSGIWRDEAFSVVTRMTCHDLESFDDRCLQMLKTLKTHLHLNVLRLLKQMLHDYAAPYVHVTS